MFVNFRSFPPSSGMFVMAETSDGHLHFSPCLADHRTARDVFATAISSGGVRSAVWIDPREALPVAIASYGQTGVPTDWRGKLDAARAAATARPVNPNFDSRADELRDHAEDLRGDY